MLHTCNSFCWSQRQNQIYLDDGAAYPQFLFSFLFRFHLVCTYGQLGAANGIQFHRNGYKCDALCLAFELAHTRWEEWKQNQICMECLVLACAAFCWHFKLDCVAKRQRRHQSTNDTHTHTRPRTGAHTYAHWKQCEMTSTAGPIKQIKMLKNISEM